MNALLLAAGLGTRLRPLTETVPKCLVPIRGRPLLGYWLDTLFEGGIERVLVNTHYLAEAVRAFVAASAWADRVCLVHETDLLGTGGTVLANRALLEGRTFLVAHADNLCSFDLAGFVEAHGRRRAGVEITMLTFDAERPSECGILEVDADGVVTGFHEKVPEPPGSLANGAVYLFEPSLLDFLSGLGRVHIDLSTEVLPRFVGRIGTFRARYLRDIGTPESLRRAQAEFVSI